MSYTAIQYLLSFALEAIVLRARLSILTMRSNVLYAVLHLAFFALGLVMSATQSRPELRVAIVLFVLEFALPVSLSVGSIRSRIARTFITDICRSVMELLGSVLYLLLGGTGPSPDVIDESNVTTVVITYVALLLTSAILFEAVIAFMRRNDDAAVQLEGPLLALMGSSVVLFATVLLRLNFATAVGLAAPIVASAYSILTLAACISLISIARQDAKATREVANREAMARQERHVRGEIEASVRRTTGMSRLRHDLANQVEVVERLAAQGRYAKADRYLEGLQAQARNLGGRR